MFKKRIKTEVVPAHEYTDYSDRFEGDEKFATLKHVALAASIPTVTAVGTGLFMFNKFNDAYSLRNYTCSCSTTSNGTSSSANTFHNSC